MPSSSTSSSSSSSSSHPSSYNANYNVHSTSHGSHSSHYRHPHPSHSSHYPPSNMYRERGERDRDRGGGLGHFSQKRDREMRDSGKESGRDSGRDGQDRSDRGDRGGGGDRRRDPGPPYHGSHRGNGGRGGGGVWNGDSYRERERDRIGREQEKLEREKQEVEEKEKEKLLEQEKEKEQREKDEENDEIEDCPLCCEAMDDTDKQFFPCACGYQICLYCYNRITQEGDGAQKGHCPACRKVYSREPLSAQQIEEIIRVTREKKAAKKAKAAKERESRKLEQTKEKNQVMSQIITNSLNHANVDKSKLYNIRVVQKNLVYVIGVPPSIASDTELRKPEYFGQYGKIIKVVVNKAANSETGTISHPKGTHSANSASAYVTFQYKEDAKYCIIALNDSIVDGRQLRASFGTTKYCNNFLRSTPCTNPECLFLHEVSENEEGFTKAEMTIVQPKGASINSTHPGHHIPIIPSSLTDLANSQVMIGQGGPSGTGKRTSKPVFPPPFFERGKGGVAIKPLVAIPVMPREFPSPAIIGNLAGLGERGNGQLVSQAMVITGLGNILAREDRKGLGGTKDIPTVGGSIEAKSSLSSSSTIIASSNTSSASGLISGHNIIYPYHHPYHPANVLTAHNIRQRHLLSAKRAEEGPNSGPQSVSNPNSVRSHGRGSGSGVGPRGEVPLPSGSVSTSGARGERRGGDPYSSMTTKRGGYYPNPPPSSLTSTIPTTTTTTTRTAYLEKNNKDPSATATDYHDERKSTNPTDTITSQGQDKGQANRRAYNTPNTPKYPQVLSTAGTTTNSSITSTILASAKRESHGNGRGEKGINNNHRDDRKSHDSIREISNEDTGSNPKFANGKDVSVSNENSCNSMATMTTSLKTMTTPMYNANNNTASLPPSLENTAPTATGPNFDSPWSKTNTLLSTLVKEEPSSNANSTNNTTNSTINVGKGIVFTGSKTSPTTLSGQGSGSGSRGNVANPLNTNHQNKSVGGGKHGGAVPNIPTPVVNAPIPMNSVWASTSKVNTILKGGDKKSAEKEKGVGGEGKNAPNNAAVTKVASTGNSRGNGNKSGGNSNSTDNDYNNTNNNSESANVRRVIINGQVTTVTTPIIPLASGGNIKGDQANNNYNNLNGKAPIPLANNGITGIGKNTTKGNTTYATTTNTIDTNTKSASKETSSTEMDKEKVRSSMLGTATTKAIGAPPGLNVSSSSSSSSSPFSTDLDMNVTSSNHLNPGKVTASSSVSTVSPSPSSLDTAASISLPDQLTTSTTNPSSSATSFPLGLGLMPPPSSSSSSNSLDTSPFPFSSGVGSGGIGVGGQSTSISNDFASLLGIRLPEKSEKSLANSYQEGQEGPQGPAPTPGGPFSISLDNSAMNIGETTSLPFEAPAPSSTLENLTSSLQPVGGNSNFFDSFLSSSGTLGRGPDPPSTLPSFVTPSFLTDNGGNTTIGISDGGVSNGGVNASLGVGGIDVNRGNMNLFGGAFGGGPLDQSNSFLSSTNISPNPDSPGLSSLLNLDNTTDANKNTTTSGTEASGPLQDLFQMLPNVSLNYPPPQTDGENVNLSESTTNGTLSQHSSDTNLSNPSPSFLQPKDWTA